MRHGLIERPSEPQMAELITIINRNAPDNLLAFTRVVAMIRAGDEDATYRALLALGADPTLQARALAITALRLAGGVEAAADFALGTLDPREVMLVASRAIGHVNPLELVGTGVHIHIALSIVRLLIDPRKLIASMHAAERMAAIIAQRRRQATTPKGGFQA